MVVSAWVLFCGDLGAGPGSGRHRDASRSMVAVAGDVHVDRASMYRMRHVKAPRG